MQHPDEGTIHAWLDDALPSDEGAEVERHVASCAECSATVAEARGMIAGASRIIGALDMVPGGVIPKAAPPQARSQPTSLWRALRITPARAALAASLLVAVSALLAKRHDTPDKMIPHAATAVVPTAVVVAPTPTPTPPPSAPAAVQSKPAAPRVAEQSKPLSAPAERPSAPDVAVVTTSVAAAPAPIAGAAKAADSGIVRMSEAVISTLQSNNGRRNFSAANQMRDVSGNAGDIAATAFAGCYQISPDSVWQSGLFPQRFALQAAPQGGSGLQHAVRSVSADGRIDSVLAGSDWHVVVPGMANVSFASSIGPQRLNLQLAPTGSVTATTPTDAGLRGLTVLRPKCVP